MRGSLDHWSDSLWVVTAVGLVGAVALTPPFEPWRTRAAQTLSVPRCVALQAAPGSDTPRCATIAYGGGSVTR